MFLNSKVLKKLEIKKFNRIGKIVFNKGLPLVLN